MIYSILNNETTFSSHQIVENLNQHGKKNEKINPIGLKIIMNNSEKMITEDSIVLLCNGDIYNSRELFHQLGIEPKTKFSFEIIIPLYKKYGIEHTLLLLDGIFSFILLDNNVETDNFKLYVARDPYGTKPLYLLQPFSPFSSVGSSGDPILGFSSNKNTLYELYKSLNDSNGIIDEVPRNSSSKSRPFIPSVSCSYELKPFLPGTYSSYILPSKVFSSWIAKKENILYHRHGMNSLMYEESSQYENATLVKNIQIHLIRAIEKRGTQNMSPIACFLGGDVGSSILAGLVKQFCMIHQYPLPETYSIGIADSPSFRQAKDTAKHLGLIHTEIRISKEEWDEEIAQCKKETECFVEMGCSSFHSPKYALYSLLAKHLSKKNNPFLFLGTGCHEVFGSAVGSSGSAVGSSKVKNSLDFDFQTKKDLSNISLDETVHTVLEKHDIRYACPFLDISFVNYYLSIPPQIRYNSVQDMDAYFLRLAFSQEYYVNTEGGSYLPDSIIWGESCKGSSGST